MLNRIFIFLFILVSSPAFCTYYVSVADGDWDSPSTWSPPSIPQLNDTSTHIQLYHSIRIPYNGQYNVKGHLTLNVGSSLFTPNQFRINGGHVVVWGYLQVHNNLWMESNGILEVWYGGFVFVDNKITYSTPSTIMLRGGTICWHNLWKGGEPTGVGVTYNDPQIEGINGCYISTGPLGIDLVSFKTRCTGDGTEISWVTENEENNDFFTVEKCRDLKKWSWVADVPGSSHSEGRLEYMVKDDDPSPGIWYYRLSQTDIDGEKTIYGEEWLRYSDCYQPEGIRISPNPVNDNVTVAFAQDLVSEIKIVDIYGSELRSIRVDSPEMTIPLHNLKPGIYFLVFSNHKSLKIVKE